MDSHPALNTPTKCKGTMNYFNDDEYTMGTGCDAYAYIMNGMQNALKDGNDHFKPQDFVVCGFGEVTNNSITVKCETDVRAWRNRQIDVLFRKTYTFTS